METGLFYWEPAWITSNLCDQWGQGSSYENVTFYDNENQPLEAFDFFNYCESPVEIKETFEHKAKVFPNPVKSYELTVKDFSPNTKWEITDLTGNVLMQGKFENKKSNTIKILNFAEGIYLLRLYSKLDGYQITKFVLR